MLVHSVFFWLKKDLNPEQVEAFHQGLESLDGIATKEALYVGAPAPTHRPVIDSSYDFALTVIFKDMADHDAYQIDPLHKRFVDRFSECWERVLVYDAE